MRESTGQPLGSPNSRAHYSTRSGQRGAGMACRKHISNVRSRGCIETQLDPSSSLSCPPRPSRRLVPCKGGPGRSRRRKVRLVQGRRTRRRGSRYSTRSRRSPRPSRVQGCHTLGRAKPERRRRQHLVVLPTYTHHHGWDGGSDGGRGGRHWAEIRRTATQLKDLLSKYCM